MSLPINLQRAIAIAFLTTAVCVTASAQDHSQSNAATPVDQSSSKTADKKALPLGVDSNLPTLITLISIEEPWMFDQKPKGVVKLSFTATVGEGGVLKDIAVKTEPSISWIERSALKYMPFWVFKSAINDCQAVDRPIKGYADIEYTDSLRVRWRLDLDTMNFPSAEELKQHRLTLLGVDAVTDLEQSKGNEVRLISGMGRKLAYPMAGLRATGIEKNVERATALVKFDSATGKALSVSYLSATHKLFVDEKNRATMMTAQGNVERLKTFNKPEVCVELDLSFALK
jgi:hypothetical protein